MGLEAPSVTPQLSAPWSRALQQLGEQDGQASDLQGLAVLGGRAGTRVQSQSSSLASVQGATGHGKANSSRHGRHRRPLWNLVSELSRDKEDE